LIACINGHHEVLKVLIEHGTDVSIVNDDKQTCLHLASMYGHFELVRVIVENGADLNAKDYKGNKASDIVGIKTRLSAEEIVSIQEYLYHAMHPPFKRKAEVLECDDGKEEDHIDNDDGNA
jgi:ankyrin repeat protein